MQKQIDDETKISEAKALLSNHRYTILQISEKMNYSNLGDFCHFLRKHTYIYHFLRIEKNN